MSIKDMASIVISLSSLLVSLTVASRTIFYQHEDVLISIRNISLKQVTKDEGDFVVEGKIDAVLINDGTTPVVINEFHYQLARAVSNNSNIKTCRSTGDFVSLQGYLDTPVVLRAGEAQVVSTKIESAENMSAAYYDSEKNHLLKGPKISVCPTLMTGYYGPLSGYGLSKADLDPFDVFTGSAAGYVSTSRDRDKDLKFRSIIDNRRFF